jgi:formylglycine-generating enzyme required for sulfatase activity
MYGLVAMCRRLRLPWRSLWLGCFFIAGCDRILGINNISYDPRGETGRAGGAPGDGGAGAAGDLDAAAGAAGAAGRGGEVSPPSTNDQGGAGAAGGPAAGVDPAAMARVLPARSCAAGPSCGPAGEAVSCCEARLVPGGSAGGVRQGCSPVNLDAESPAYCHSHDWPEHEATVSDVWLDTFEVTVSRFRAFVAAYDAWRAAGNPAPGDGAVRGVEGSGWRAEFDPQLAPSAEALRRDMLNAGGEAGPTWAESGRDDLPINNVFWFEALAFCIWDNGRLPTDAEWEYAAAGGPEGRSFPWGPTPPEPDVTVAPRGALPRPVGERAAGRGRWGHHDLAGNVNEWTYDVNQPYPRQPASPDVPCRDCAVVLPAGSLASSDPKFSLRGGSIYHGGGQGEGAALAAFLTYRRRGGSRWTTSYGELSRGYVGFRCARPAAP